MFKKALGIIAASALFVGALENPAHSARATYATVGFWEIVGDSTNGTCAAKAVYDNDTTIVLVLDSSAVFFLGLSSPMVAMPDQDMVELQAQFNGHPVTLLGSAGGGSFVSKDDERRTLSTRILVAKTASVQGYGVLNLEGLLPAFLKTIECVKALSGEDV